MSASANSPAAFAAGLGRPRLVHGDGPDHGMGKAPWRSSNAPLIDTHPSILPLGPGACAGGVVIRNGATVVRMKVSLDETSEQLASLPSYGSTTFGYRYLASPGPGIAAVDQLTESTPTNVRFAGIWRGKPWLQFGEGDNEELTQLGEIEVLEGYLYRRGWTLERNARLVHDYAAEAAVHA